MQQSTIRENRSNVFKEASRSTAHKVLEGEPLPMLHLGIGWLSAVLMYRCPLFNLQSHTVLEQNIRIDGVIEISSKKIESNPTKFLQTRHCVILAPGT
jgi:hypothetical protein